MVNHDMNELERELLYTVCDSFMKIIIKSVGIKNFDYNYFLRLGISKKIFENAEYDLFVDKCDYLIKRGKENTNLDSNKIEFALRHGKNRGDIIVNIAKYGSIYINKILGKERILH